MSPDPFFLSTAIAYVNGVAHMGHALEFILADAIARFQRTERGGDAVHFLTGTDEHGVKIVKTAKEAGIETKALVDKNAAAFMALKDTFSLSWDDFIRTSDKERHFPAVQKLWQKLVDAGDLYEKEYEGKYCYGCEEFKNDKDLTPDGLCPIHLRAPDTIKEKNWFFRLSRYSDTILQKLESNEIALVPSFRKNEILNVVREGLTDVSFSRPVTSLPWGIPVPGDPSQVMYVWCDALANYISAIHYATEDDTFQKWWPASMHIIGKDIVRFHAGIWIGMLLSANLPLPKSILVHGFVTSEGQKMSKSLGNVVDPVAVATEWGVDALRYYLLSEIPLGQDGDFSKKRFTEKYNGELGNALGNLVSRITTLGSGADLTAATLDPTLAPAITLMHREVSDAMHQHDPREALQAIFRLAAVANGYLQEKKPWETKDASVILTTLEIVRHIALALEAFLPTTSTRILSALGTTFAAATYEKAPFHPQKITPLFPRKDWDAA